MAYKSIDELQTLLSSSVFGDRRDNKKAAGRALGTFIETIVFYLLRYWGESDVVAIERPLAEYGREEITHNVEFTLHPIVRRYTERQVSQNVPLTAKRIVNELSINGDYQLANNKLIDKGVLQNGYVVGYNNNTMTLANLDNISTECVNIHATELAKHAYAMIECKRVGKEGDAKGPQTIEKAKQGAYVAKVTSLLQKIRNDKGELDGIYYIDGKAHTGPYNVLLDNIINGNNPQLLRHFTLSIGVVSNHGNWFTAENQNKEMKVLAQSYDWLLFLTDEGLAQFITDLLVNPNKDHLSVREAFLASYRLDSTNVFTKKRMELNAHFALDRYFMSNAKTISSWFNIISPDGRTLQDLRNTLETLKNKNWENIL